MSRNPRSWAPVALGLMLLVFGDPVVHAQVPSTPPIKALVTTDAPLTPGSTFAMPPSEVMNEAGDYLFVTSSSALFLRRAGVPAPVRVFQMGDPVPGIPHSLASIIQDPQINQAGRVAFSVEYFAEDTTRSAIFTHDGASFTKIAAATDIAPNSDGSPFGRGLDLLGLNGAGDVAFTAPLVPVGAPRLTPTKTTIYIAAAGAGPVRIAGPGDVAPGTDDGTMSQIAVYGFNNRREVLFRAAVTGGSGGFGLFVGSMAGVRKIVAHGDVNPAGGLFELSASNQVPKAVLNNAGQVALGTLSALFVSTPGENLAVAVSLATPVPTPLEATSLHTINGFAGFNDSGDILFPATLDGTTTNNTALFRYTAGNPLEIVAYRGQPAPAPAPDGWAFGSFTLSGTVFNNAGDAVFYSRLTPVAPDNWGLFKKPSGGAVEAVVLNGQAAPGSVGGAYELGGYSRLLGDGSVYFESEIRHGTPTAGTFLATADGVQVLVTNADPLPAGSNMVFRNIFMWGAGTYAGFLAKRAGGADALMVHNMATHVTSRAAMVGEPSPLPGGTPFTSVGGTVHLNASGTVVFSGGVAGQNYLFVWNAAGGIQKLVGFGDPVPDTAALTFSQSSLPGMLFSQINTAGQVAFKGVYQGGTGLFVAAAGGTPVGVVRTGDTAPTGGTFTGTFGNFLINDAGQVAFSATTSTGTAALFVGTPGSAPVKVVAAGDPAPGGAGTFSGLTSPAPAGFNAAGVVTFYATLTGPAGSGLFAGTAGGDVQAIALSGTTAPAGGGYAFSLGPSAWSKDVRINDAGDILFQAPLAGGSADSGLFLRRGGTGVIESVALQGQVASGASYPLGTIEGTINGYPGETFALGPKGDVMFHGPIDVSGRMVYGLFRYRGPGTLERLLLRGEPVPDSDGGTAGSMSNNLAIGAPGLFFFRMMVVEGAFADGIYAADTAPPTVSAVTDSPLLWPPPGGRLQAVTIYGSAADDGSGVAGTEGSYEVVDEYGLVQPRGTFTVEASGAFSFVVTLEASRRGTDRNGRVYTVRVTVRDVYGNATPTTVNIVVPPSGRK